MHQSLNPQNLIWYFGGAVLLLAVLLLVVYGLQKSFSRGAKPEEAKSQKVRVKDEAAFTLATVKGLISQLKEEQTALQAKLVAAERRADQNVRKFDLLAREIDFGLMIFDAEGFMTFSNPQVRKVLAVDTWARRRYSEIFQALPALTELIATCFETGSEARQRVLEIQGWNESKSDVQVSVLPARDCFGRLEMVACVFREVAPVSAAS